MVSGPKGPPSALLVGAAGLKPRPSEDHRLLGCLLYFVWYEQSSAGLVLVIAILSATKGVFLMPPVRLTSMVKAAG